MACALYIEVLWEICDGWFAVLFDMWGDCLFVRIPPVTYCFFNRFGFLMVCV